MKQFYVQTGIGRAKYVVNFHDGIKLNPDRSDFWECAIFKNKKALAAFLAKLGLEGYREGHTMTNYKTVTIPALDEHEGVYAMTVRLPWVCPICGEPRGAVVPVRSYDGSRILYCDGWTNACGHVDKYPAVREEAARLAAPCPYCAGRGFHIAAGVISVPCSRCGGTGKAQP